jgi:glycosyltransferase involved in cell wall biosynthesis
MHRATRIGVPQMLAPIYVAADLLLLTPRIEGLPLAVIEALATGCPVAATDVGDIGCIVHDGVNGRLGSADNTSSLVEPIAAIATDPESWHTIRAAARGSVLSSPYRLTKTAAYEALLI